MMPIVADLATSHWKDARRAYLLSQLGVDLRRRVENFDEWLNGRRVVAAIADDFSSIVKVVRSSKGIFGIVPVGIDLPADTDVLFGPPEPPPSEAMDTARIPWFNRAFWAAFVKPLEVDSRRFVGFREQKVCFVDSPEPPPDLDEPQEISRNFIAKDEKDGDKDATYERIKTWAEERQIPINSFYGKSTSSRGSTGMLIKQRPTLTLGQLIDKLSDAELSRLSIPADVLKRALAAL